MIVKITQADINKAKRVREKFKKRETFCYCRADSCPLAFALKRLFSESRVYVMPWGIYIGRVELCRNDDTVKSFIENTDRKKDKIRPQNLEVPISL